MNWRAMIGAVDVDGLTPNEKLVLLVVTRYANDSGACWPGLKLLAEKTGLSTRTVMRTLEKLLRRGLLVKKLRYDERGKRTFSGFQLSDKLCHLVSSLSDNDDALSDNGDTLLGDNGDISGAPIYSYEASRREASIEASIPPSKSPSSRQHEEQEEGLTLEGLVEGWNDICVKAGLPRVRELTRDRKSKARERIKEHSDVDWWSEVMTRVADSRFCCGGGERKNGTKPWKATFDWLIKNEQNAVKVLEGNYDDEKTYAKSAH